MALIRNLFYFIFHSNLRSFNLVVCWYGAYIKKIQMIFSLYNNNTHEAASNMVDEERERGDATPLQPVRGVCLEVQTARCQWLSLSDEATNWTCDDPVAGLHEFLSAPSD